MKLLIFFVAVILSCFGFYLISSPFVCLHMSVKEADTEMSDSYPAKYDVCESMRSTGFYSYGGNLNYFYVSSACK